MALSYKPITDDDMSELNNSIRRARETQGKQRKEIIKVRAENNEIENRKTIGKNH